MYINHVGEEGCMWCVRQTVLDVPQETISRVVVVVSMRKGGVQKLSSLRSSLML